MNSVSPLRPTANGTELGHPHDDVSTAPIREFVLKVSSRCNLRCSYCYVYAMGDESWRRQPAIIPSHIVSAAATRIAEHAAHHGLDRVGVVLHGGEPLLCGPDGVAIIADTLRRAMPSGVMLDIRLQTNGVLVTEDFMRVFRKHRILVGVSIDGSPAAQRRRPTRAGSDTYAAALRAIQMLRRPETSDLYAGVLSVVHLDSSPAETLAMLSELDAPDVDLLLPHATWDKPPIPGHGAWLAAAFDIWFDQRPVRLHVRLFRDVLGLVLGMQVASPHVGLAPSQYAVIDTDGGLQATDVLKAAYDGAADTGMNVATHSFDELLRHPAMITRQGGATALADACRSCRELTVCGGGNYVHRYRPGHGFQNRSVYCGDLLHLIGHVRRRLAGLRAAAA